MDPITFNENKFFSIPNFDKYFISRSEKILSVKNKNPKILNYRLSNTGYKTYRLFKNGKSLDKNLHRLLAMTFLKDFSPELQVDHKDNNKLNNDLSNLRMVTVRGNSRNMTSCSGVNLNYQTCNDTFYYVSTWYDELGVQHRKAFSCKKYGFGFALMMAHAKRDEMVKLYYNRPD